MKTIYLFLLLSLNAVANNNIKYMDSIINPASTSKNEIEPAKSNSISGLKIVTYTSEKLGKHIYIVSDIYTKKKAYFYNENGKLVYSIRTVGSPIRMSKLDKGTYKIRIVEGKKTEMRELTVE